MSEDETKIISALGHKYEIKRLIASGGMGDIYLGVHRALDRQVAIKIVHKELSKDEEFKKRFYREAKLSASLQHPVIIEIFDFGSKDDFDYIIMPYIEGSTLQERLRREERFGVQECVRLMILLTDALSYAHNKNVVHRDIKPSNIMIDNRGHLILTDFGISKDLGDLGLTLTQTVLGSPKYMSPEQIRGLDVDARSDLYSLGLLFFEMITGKHPFEGKDATSIYYCQVHETPQRPEASVPDVPDQVGDIIMKLLEKSPERRYQNCAQLLRDLESYRSRFSQDSRVDIDATVMGAQMAVRPVEVRAEALPLGQKRDSLAEKGQRFWKERKGYRWLIPALGVTLIIVIGIVWTMRSRDTEYLPAESLSKSESEIAYKVSDEPARISDTGLSYDSIVKRVLVLGQEREATFLQLWTDKSQFRIGDELSYHFRSDKDCYLVVLSVTTSGDLFQLFPNSFSLSQFVEAKKSYTIPGAEMDIELRVTGPAGKEEIVALAAETPFDLLSAKLGNQVFFQVDREDQALLDRIGKNIRATQRLHLAQKRVSYSIVD